MQTNVTSLLDVIYIIVLYKGFLHVRVREAFCFSSLFDIHIHMHKHVGIHTVFEKRT